MISIISPAKSLDFSPMESTLGNSVKFPSKARKIVQNLANLSLDELAETLNISQKVAKLNYERFQQFATAPQKPALFAYDGDVYKNIEKDKLNQEDITFADEHLIILSGLYGPLKPMDSIKPYRLEMATKLKYFALGDDFHGDFANFWQKDVTNFLSKQLAKHKSKYVVNIASNEYSKAIDRKNFNYGIFDIFFLEERNGQMKNIAINSKKARGMMANFIIRNHIDNIEDVKKFTASEYHYDKSLSSSHKLYFCKKQST